MKKVGLFVSLGLVVVLVGAAVVLRMAAKGFLESDEFRTELRGYLEQGAGSVIPRAMADVKAVKLVGLATIEIQGIKIQSTKDLNANLNIPRVAVTPALTSLIGKGPARITGEGEVAGGGRFDFGATIPKSLVDGGEVKRAATILAQGNLQSVDVVPVASLLFADAPSNPNFSLTRGKITGSFAFQKPFGGHAAHGRKSGDINVKLESPAWTLAVGPVKKLEPPALDVHLEIKDFALELRAPVVLQDKIGRAAIAGALLLPERADRTLAWDLDVKTEGVLVQGSMAKLFKCKQPPQQSHFTVKGPIAATTCK